MIQHLTFKNTFLAFSFFCHFFCTASWKHTQPFEVTNPKEVTFVTREERQVLHDDDPIHARDKNGHTLLHRAVQQDQPQEVARLLKAGANPELVDLHYRTALKVAVQSNSPKSAQCVRYLVEEGAEITPTILAFALGTNNEDSCLEKVKLLQQSGMPQQWSTEMLGVNPIETLRCGATLKLVKSLLDARSNVELNVYYPLPPLTLIAFSATSEILLLARLHQQYSNATLQAAFLEAKKSRTKEIIIENPYATEIDEVRNSLRQQVVAIDFPTEKTREKSHFKPSENFLHKLRAQEVGRRNLRFLKAATTNKNQTTQKDFFESKE